MDTRINESRDGYLLAVAAGGTKRHVLPPQERCLGHEATALCGHRPANTAYMMKRRGKWYHSRWALVPENVTCAKCAGLYRIAIERETVMTKQRVKLKMFDVIETTVTPPKEPKQAELHLYVDDSCKGITFGFDPSVTAYTPWSKDTPPAIGLWEVRKSGTDADAIERWWFGGAGWLMTDAPHRAVGVAGMTHEQFAVSHMWRGLYEKPKQDYACPPYDLRTLPAGAQLDVWVPVAPRRAPTRDAAE